MAKTRRAIAVAAPSEISTCLALSMLLICVAAMALTSSAAGVAVQTARWEGGNNRSDGRRLMVIVSKTGFVVSFGRIRSDGPPERLHVETQGEQLRIGLFDCAGSHDFERLHQSLRELHRALAGLGTIAVTAEDDMPLSDLVRTIDVAKAAGFTDVLVTQNIAIVPSNRPNGHFVCGTAAARMAARYHEALAHDEREGQEGGARLVR